MYVEFVYIYVGLGVVAALLVAAIVLLCVVLKRTAALKGGSVGRNSGRSSQAPAASQVFCKKCGGRMDAGVRVCPNCGTVR